ncbi:MAG: hypothetical protein ACLQDV_18800 [Candidatus Binataceae bacterium]
MDLRPSGTDATASRRPSRRRFIIVVILAIAAFAVAGRMSRLSAQTGASSTADSGKTIYVAGNDPSGADTGIVGVDPKTGSQWMVSKGGIFQRPYGVAIDPDGTLVVSDPEADAIVRVDATTGQQTEITSKGLLANPLGVAVESSGAILVADRNSIIQVDPSTGAQSVLSSGGALIAPQWITIDQGSITVENADGSLVAIDPENGAQTPAPGAQNGNAIIVADSDGGVSELVRVDSSGLRQVIAKAGLLHEIAGVATLVDTPQAEAGKATPKPKPSRTPTPAKTPAPKPTKTPTVTKTPAPKPTRTPTVTKTPAPKPTKTATSTKTATPKPTSTASGCNVNFTVPNPLPTAVAGIAYSQSACAPVPSGPNGLCGGAGSSTSNPTGGNPPYHFTTSGFPPIGINVQLNGLINGTASEGAIETTASFQVCAVDTSSCSVCRATSIAVKDKFDGVYSGTYTGTATDQGMSQGVSGGVGFSVRGLAITVTAPGTGSGGISSTGTGNFGSAGGGVGTGDASCSFGGNFVANSTGTAASASGGWSCSFDGGNGQASGTWSASD